MSDFCFTSRACIIWLLIMGGTAFFVYLKLLPLPWSVMLPMLLWAAYTDIRYRIIPNTVPLVLTLTGFYLNPDAAITGLLGCFLILAPLYIKKWIGGGDVKLTAGIGAALGYAGGIYALFYSNLFALVYVIIRKICQRKIRAWIKETAFTLKTLGRHMDVEVPDDIKELMKVTVPLGAFFLPAALVVFLTTR